MPVRAYPVLVEVAGNRVKAGFRAPSTESPVQIALQLRERGWDPYRVMFDAAAGAWIARALERKKADGSLRKRAPAH
jgi:nitrogen fixation protein FixH